LKSFTLLILFLLCNFASAQKQDSADYFTSEIDVNSFLNEIDIFTSPSNISILNKKSIQRRNGSNVSDILKTVSGVFVKSYGSSTALQTISMNGLGAEHTVILLNGIKLNSLQNGQIDLSLIPSDNIKKIEVMNNGYSSMFGSEAMGGVVNIITEDFSNPKPLAMKLSTEFGSYKARKYLAKVTSSIKNFSWDFLLSDERSDNDYEFYFNNGIENELKNKENSAYKISNYVLSSQYNFSPDVSIKYFTQFLNSDREIPGIETGITPPKTRQLDKNWNNGLQFSLYKKSFSVHSDFNFQNNLMNYNTPPILNSFYKNIVLSNTSRLEITNLRNTFAVGTEILYGTLNSNELKNDINREHYSVFTANKIEWKNLLIYPSLRYDYITDISKGAVTYRLGFNYSLLLKGNLFLRVNVSRNFGVPTFNGLYWKTGGNPNLKPEYSQNYEGGFTYTGKFLVNYAFDVNYLNINLEDRIVWLPGRNFIWSPVNIGKAKSEIVISSLRLNYTIGKTTIRGEVSYTHNDSKKTNEDFPGDPSVNKQILYIPQEEIKSNMEFSFGPAGINLFHTYIGKRYSDTENLYPLRPVNILDGNIFFDYKISNYTASLKFEVNNITNSDYQIIAGYPAPLRNYNFKINLNYTL
jgi:iron complex outermembrane receptor protein